MTTLAVGTNQQFTTLAAAVAAAQPGDTVAIQAGTYTFGAGEFPALINGLTIEGVGGIATLVATAQPSNGKALLDVAGTTILSNLDISGVTVPDANGAAVRYEGGSLTIKNTAIHDNQNGILGAADGSGSIVIDGSEFYNNGLGGDGHTHNIYVGQIASFKLTNSYIHDANVGHEVKSRAASNDIENNRIEDNGSTASYEIDLPNGGVATIAGNTIQKSASSQNPNAISYGEEGMAYSTNALSVTNNTFVSDRSNATILQNASSTDISASGNNQYGFANIGAYGHVSSSGFTTLSARPALNTTSPIDTSGGGASSGSNGPSSGGSPGDNDVPIATAITLGSGPNTLELAISEDAWQGDAQFTISVDGQQIGDVQTATASHAAGMSQAFDIKGSFASGSHTVSVNFLNDAYGGSSSTDRNLYVTGATLDGSAIPSSSLTEYSGGSQSFGFQSGNTLTLGVSEDAYQGDAQYRVLVDGVDTGATYTATASHAAGQINTQTITGTWGGGGHTIGIQFINDAYDGSPATDRNLYINLVSYDGVAAPLSGTIQQASNGTATVEIPYANRFALALSEDAWEGDAQFALSIDGQQVAANTPVTASHAAGATQLASFDAMLTPGNHDVALSFVNDAYAGTPSTDRNLYLVDAFLNGKDLGAATWSRTFFSAETAHFNLVVPTS